MSRVLVGLLALSWSAALWMLLTSSKVPQPAWIPWRRYVFNVAHAPLFGIEALLLAACVAGSWSVRRLGARAVVSGACLALVYGAVLEWRQGLVPGRRSSALDLLTDGVGAFGLPWALRAATPLSARALLVALAAVAAGVLATVESAP